MLKESKLKILWFSNTPANGVLGMGINSLGSGTWLQTLDLALQDKVDLNIAFYHSENIHFTVGNTNYFGIAKYKNYLEKIKYKILERFFDYVFDTEHLNEYLKIVDLVKPDLIHIHGTENPFGCLIGKISNPIIVSIQGLTNSVLRFYSVGIGEKYLKTRQFSFKSSKELFFPTNFNNAKEKFIKMSVIERKNLVNCQHIIGRTEWDKMITSVLAPKSTYYHNDEIMRKEFYSNEWSHIQNNSKEIIIHTTSDNVYYKGLETICDTILLLNTYGYNCIWNVAGINPTDLIVSVVKKRLKQEYPHKSINFLGKLSTIELLDKMLKANCFVMASHIENSSNSLCEAMLIGMPSIATNAGGTSSIMTHRIDGILVQPGDCFSLAAAIIELFQNKELAICIGKNARTKSLNRHSKEKIINDLLNTYNTILS